MALNPALGAIAAFCAFSAISLVTVETICVVKTIKAEKAYEQIGNRLTAVRDAAGTGASNLTELVQENDKKNKEDQKKQKAQIDSINKEVQLKNDIEALQAQIEQAKRDLGTANTAKDKLQKAKNTFHQMEVDLNAIAGMNDNVDVQALLDSGLWSPILGPAGARITPVYNDGAANEWANHKDAVLTLAANVNGHRTGALYNAGAFSIASLVEILGDRRGGHAAGAHVAGGGVAPVAHHLVAQARQFLQTAWNEDFDKKVDEIAGYNKTIEENTAQIKEKQAQLEALKKNK